MMKKFAVLPVVVCLLLAACMPSIPNPTTVGGAQVTTAPPPPATTAPAPTATDPVPTTMPTDPQDTAALEAFTDLFRPTEPERNPFFWATGHEYASPKELQLIAYFDGGFPDEHEMTDAEWDELSKLVQGPGETDFNRLPKDKMEAELQAAFGISLADLPDSAFSGLFYLDSTECYYFFQGGMTSCPVFLPFLAVDHNGDGTVSLTYENGVGNYVITLKPQGDSYLILSNIKAE